MAISYENEINLAFDKPLIYKGILLYPITLPYYSLFAAYEDCLDVNRLDERDIRLLRMPYLDYMYNKSLVDEEFKNKWNMLLCVLGVVLREEQPLEILQQDGEVYIKVYQRSEQYELLNKEYAILEKNFIAEHETELCSEKELNEFKKKANKIKEKMYKFIVINGNEFDDIRELIMIQNDVKIQNFDSNTEKLLIEMKNKLKQVKKSQNDLTLEDLITIVSYSIGKNPIELENMTIRRFNRYLSIVIKKDDYLIYKQLEASGMIELKSKIPHWISHYEPKGKYDDLLVDSENLMSSLNDK